MRKTIILTLTFFTLICIARAQQTESTPTDEELNKVYSLGTFLGKTYKEIDEIKIFGNRRGKLRSGRYNIPHSLEYSTGLGSAGSPYIVEVGFFADKSTAYFLYQKKTFAGNSEFNTAELTALLYQVAQGGKWKKMTNSEDHSIDYKGDLFEYTHSHKKQNLRFFAYRTPSKKQLLVYSPLVSPNLQGTRAAPNVELAFSNGVRVPWISGDPDGTTVVRYMEITAPKDLISLAKSENQKTLLEKFENEVFKSDRSPSTIDTNTKDYLAAIESRKIETALGKGIGISKIKDIGIESKEVKSIVEQSKADPEKLKVGLKSIQNKIKPLESPKW